VTERVAEGPLVGDEIAGEPVEQFRVGGWAAAVAEVARGGDEACVEAELPEPVDDDAGGEGVIRGGDPCGEGGAATGGGIGGWGLGEDDGDAVGDGGFRVIGVALTEDADGLGVRVFRGDEGEGEWFETGFVGGDAGFEPFSGGVLVFGWAGGFFGEGGEFFFCGGDGGFEWGVVLADGELVRGEIDGEIVARGDACEVGAEAEVVLVS